jgi:hypothetical protein
VVTIASVRFVRRARADTFPRSLYRVTLIRRLVLLSAAILTTLLSSAAFASSAQLLSQAVVRKATLATFAGLWIGHTRALTIKPDGRGRESIGDGCCDPIIDLDFRLSRPSGTTQNATATATVTAVKVHDRSVYTKTQPAPRIGETRTVRLKGGVITDELTGADYCDARAENDGTCGA